MNPPLSVRMLLPAALLAAALAGCDTPPPSPTGGSAAAPRGASPPERAQRRAELLRHFDRDRDGNLSPAEAATAVEGERRARRDPETVMRYEALREAHVMLLEAAAEGDEGWVVSARKELQEARAVYRERRRAVLADPAPGPAASGPQGP